MLAKYRSVLSLPGALRLFASALVGRLPQGMSSLAILLLVRGATHSYAAAGVAVGAFALATAAAAQRRSSPRAAVADHGRPRVGPSITQNSAPIGSSTRAASHGAR